MNDLDYDYPPPARQFDFRPQRITGHVTIRRLDGRVHTPIHPHVKQLDRVHYRWTRYTNEGPERIRLVRVGNEYHEIRMHD